MFGKKNKEKENRVEESNASWANLHFVKDNEDPLFKSIRGLLYEAESQFKEQELQLCDDILAVVVRHIKRNRFVSKQVIAPDCLTDLQKEE